MLTFMVRGIFTKLEFPYAQFPTRGVTADKLFPIVWDAVRNLEECGLKVMVITCDGAWVSKVNRGGLFYRRVACRTFARSSPFFRCSLPKRSNFSTAFAKFAYLVPSGSYSVAKSAVFAIDRNSEYPKIAQECTPDVDVTVINENCITQSVIWKGL